MLTTAKSRCTIYTGVLYLHNGFVRSKKKEFVKSFPLKETEYIAEDFKAEIAHTLFDVMLSLITVSKVGA